MSDFRDLLPPPPWEVFQEQPKYKITEKGRVYVKRVPALPIYTLEEGEASLWGVVAAVEREPGTSKDIAKRMGTLFFPGGDQFRRAMRAAFEEGYIEEVKE